MKLPESVWNPIVQQVCQEPYPALTEEWLKVQPQRSPSKALRLVIHRINNSQDIRDIGVSSIFDEPHFCPTLHIDKASDQDDAKLQNLTGELLKKRQLLKESIIDEIVRSINGINDGTLEEIKLLTKRLHAFLSDLKSQIEASSSYDDIIPRLKNEWNGLIEDWSCDVRMAVKKSKERITAELGEGKYKLVDSRKYTTADVDLTISDLVTRINHLTIQNYRTYAETECHLKLIFDELLRKWLISFTHQEMNRLHDFEDENEESEMDRTRQNILQLLNDILPLLDDFDVNFARLTIFDLYIDHLGVCKKHAKLNLKEALLLVRSHLEEPLEDALELDIILQSQALWHEIVLILKEQNSDIDNYCKESAAAWNKFVKRLHCAEATTNLAINKIRSRTLNKTLRSETQINVLLDELREGSNAAQMKRVHSRILHELETIENECVSSRDEEDNILEHTISACCIAYDILSSQLELLNELKQSAHTTEQDCKLMDYDNPSTDITIPKFVTMKYCVFSAQSWVEGFKETVSLLEAELPNFLGLFLKNLVFTYKGDSEYWLMLQLEKLMERKRRIMKTIYDTRIFELQAHEAAQKNLITVAEAKIEEANQLLQKVKEQLKAKDSAMLKHLEETKTTKLEDTPEKKINHIKRRAAIAELEANRFDVIEHHKQGIEKIFDDQRELCSSFLGIVKLFHEGGNYSSEECEVAVKKVTKITGSSSKNCKKYLKNLDKIYTATREAFKSRLGKIVYPSPTEEEILRAAERRANDRLEILFNQLKEMIKLETYKTATSLEFLKNKMDEAKRINEMATWQEIMSKVYSISGYFAPSRACPFTELIPIVKEKKSSLATVSLRRKKSQASRSKLSLSERGKIRHKKSIISTSSSTLNVGYPYEDVNSFLCNTKTLIGDAYSKIKPILTSAYSAFQLTRNHYAHQKTTIDALLKHYNMQCEVIWSFLLNEYMRLLQSLCTNVVSYINLMKDRHLYNLTSNAMNLRTEHRANLAKLNVKGVKESIDNKLKPWHGYPLNKNLLQDLLIIVAKHCKEHLTARKMANETFRDQLKELAITNRTTTLELLEDTTNLTIALLADPAINSFFELLHKFISDLSSCIVNNELKEKRIGASRYCTHDDDEKSSDRSRTKKTDGYDVIALPFLTGFDLFKFKLYLEGVFDSVRIIQQETKWFYDRESAYDEEEEKNEASIFQFHTDHQVHVPFLLKFCNEMEAIVEDFDRSVIEQLKTAKKDFDSISWDLRRWKNEWISNIKEVNRLYLIAPILDPPPKKLAADPAAVLRIDKSANIL